MASENWTQIHGYIRNRVCLGHPADTLHYISIIIKSKAVFEDLLNFNCREKDFKSDVNTINGQTTQVQPSKKR